MPTARELGQQLGRDALTMREDDPDRILYGDFLDDIRKHEKLKGVAKSINEYLGQLPDEIQITEVVPQYISTATNKGIAAAEEARAESPIWATLHEQSDPAEKGHLARFVRTLRDPMIETEGIKTLGDLRNISIENLIRFKTGISPFTGRMWAAVVKSAVKKTSSEGS